MHKPSHPLRQVPLLGVPHSPVRMWDLVRSAFTWQRPEPRRRSFVQGVLDCSGRKAASQPPNEWLFERRLNPPLYVQLAARQPTSEKSSYIHSKGKVKIELNLLTSYHINKHELVDIFKERKKQKQINKSKHINNKENSCLQGIVFNSQNNV